MSGRPGSRSTRPPSFVVRSQDGAWFVDLSPLQDEDLLVSTVARALRLQSRSRAWAPAALTRHLVDLELLIVLDNCEQRARRLRRARRRAPSCVSLPPRPRHQQAGAGDLGGAAGGGAAAGDARIGRTMSRGSYSRSTTRSRCSPSGRRPSPRDSASATRTTQAVAALCQRLDGIPLALELAAARLRVLSPQQILDRLEEHSDVLRSGSTVAPERHRSLRSLIDWSYGLCSTEERTLWARLGVFPGSFDLEAVEQVCAGDDPCHGNGCWTCSLGWWTSRSC